MRKFRVGWLSSLALLMAIVAVLLVALAGPAYRAGWVGLGTALQRMLTWGAFAGIGAVVLGLLGLIVTGGRRRALALTAEWHD